MQSVIEHAIYMIHKYLKLKYVNMCLTDIWLTIWWTDLAKVDFRYFKISPVELSINQTLTHTYFEDIRIEMVRNERFFKPYKISRMRKKKLEFINNFAL